MLGKVLKPNIVAGDIRIKYPVGIHFGIAMFNVGVAIEKLGFTEDDVTEADLNVNFGNRSYSVKLTLKDGKTQTYSSGAGGFILDLFGRE